MPCSSLADTASRTRRAAASAPNTSTLAAKLARLGLTAAELPFHLPLRYEDETRITPVAAAISGQAAQFEVEVRDCEIAFRPRRQLICHVADATGELALRFLNFYPNQQKLLSPGARLRVFGEPRGGFFGNELIHPRFRRLEGDEPLPERLTPVYPTTAGLGQGTLRRLVQKEMAQADLADTLPEALRQRFALAELAPSLEALHQPPPVAGLDELDRVLAPAWRRIRFDELLAQQLSLRQAYAARRARGAAPLPASGRLTDGLLRHLPFTLTGAQRRAWQEIAADLAQPHPMQRLLQGDVGSGKTIVAALAMLQAADSGYQAALMAPTEILAEQHYRKLAAWLEPLGLPVAWLTGSLRKSEKAAMAGRIASGETLLAVGTHALIEDEITFARLGLSIVDEQHRFGVRQRLALKQKAVAPHQLTMSATPIPRTLAMSYYADLDVSVLDELPPGRTPVLTKLVGEGRRAEVVARVRAACGEGRQVYWVCPLIEESETLQLKTAEETYDHLRTELPELRTGLVHGRLRPEEKAAVMDAFLRNEIQVLVATTVIEVGVDVPNASLMIIEHAERFGLSQLHQLRGRVGRGSAESVCILLYARPLSATARQRLKIIYENTDGFEIARQDLALRGPGEFIGSRQSGMPLLRYAQLDDSALVEAARAAADVLLRDHPAQAVRHIRRWLKGAEEYLKA
ncbi:ATP-dependent DNA helicase RecG [Denitratisoma sp. DHT3]|uniref:ATP-dependent DNA helicase RecG n=1 Tax=Denitratisoma sp. DHT3 TaxID=1981880 RepID=UPI0011987592|nr:ATP-dependent DNA helicase RecG [Denitratisoma sp. DHT3]QDX82260.1 ATP-dependent DNA helicase RecG [Denitratisoma sp. DHT3]